MIETLFWVWLTSNLNFYSSSVQKVIYKFTPEQAYNASPDELSEAGLDGKIVERLSNKSLDRAEDIIDKCKKKKISIVHAMSPAYPHSLDRLKDKPFVLYVRGDISCISGKKTAAFIGTRKMTVRGEENAVRIAEELIDSGKILVSGIADGIDAVSSKVSLEKGVPSVAVLGVDIDKYYPKINERLIDKVAETGAVISEYPPDTGARYFATRNRIIVGLSDSVNVIEADSNSGALIGGELALKMKIPTFALDLGTDSFSGCRCLIEKGAKPLEGSVLGVKAQKPAPEKKVKKEKQIPDAIDGTRRHIWNMLLKGAQNEEAFVDELHSMPEILVALTELELDGFIKALPGGKYELK